MKIHYFELKILNIRDKGVPKNKREFYLTNLHYKTNYNINICPITL